MRKLPETTFWFSRGASIRLCGHANAAVAVLPSAESSDDLDSIRLMKLFKALFNQRQGTPDSEKQPNPVRRYPQCECFAPAPASGTLQEVIFHREVQNTRSDAWQALEAYIQKVEDAGSDELNPLAGIGPEKWEQIVALPASIARLQSVKFLSLYGSHLVRIPPEIGEMTNLEEFDPYTSYCLHWFPYEIMRCRNLNRSRVSTRALYGNYKHRPPFPRLPVIAAEFAPAACSVCRGPFAEGGPHQRWISLRVATDVLPLLVHACSNECIQKLPVPAEGYVQTPHQGGLRLEQPQEQ